MFYRKYLRHYKKETIIAPLFKFLEAAFELAIPILVAYVIDVGIANGDKGYILKMGAVMVGMGILGLLCSLLAQYYSAVAAFGFGTEVRAACYRRINAFSFKELDGIGIPTLITRITQDVNNAQTGVNRFLRLILRAPFIILGTVVASFLIDWRAGLIFLVTVPVLGAVIYFVMRACIRGNGKIQKNLDEVSLRTRETLAGARVVRAFSRQEEEIAAFDDSVTRLNKLQVAVGRISALLNPATYAIINVAIICILWFGGGLVFQGVLEQGEITALINYMTQDLLAAVAFAELVIMMAQGEASAKRIRALLATEPSMADGAGAEPDGQAPLIELDDVSFSYADGAENALEHISLSVKRGETVGIIGGTGAGKSTLVNLLPRFYDATEGSVKIKGADVRTWKMRELRALFGVVPQKAALFSGTIRDNLKWGKEDASDEELWTAARIGEAAEFLTALPDGLDHPVEQGGRNLSGGQRQRLTIARALVRQPEILILDDSASALDYATDARLRKNIRGLAGRTTAIIVSQRVSAIRNADRIYLLDDGRIAAVGTHEALFSSSERYREICASQHVGEEEA